MIVDRPTGAGTVGAPDGGRPAPPERPPGWAGTGPAECWAGTTALGAGLVNLALASQNRAVLPALVAFALLGGYQLLWGLGTLGLPRPPLPRTTAAVLVLAAVGTTALAIAGSPLVAVPGRGPGMAALGATTLQLAALAGLLLARRLSDHGGPERTSSRSTLRALGGLAAAALLTAALATPAMADTAAGEHARPHGGHLFPNLHQHH